MSDLPVPAISRAVLTRGAVLDVFTTEEGTVVLVGDPPLHHVVRLSALGSEIFDAVGDGCTVQQLEEQLRARLGEPPEGLGSLTDLVADAVRELHTLRVVSLAAQDISDL